MINLLLLTNQLNYSDGVASHLFNLINGLKETGDINVFLGCSGGNSLSKFEKTGIRIRKDKDYDHSSRSLKKYSGAIIKTLNFCNKNKIDIIHSHNHYAANIGYYAARFSNSKSINTVQTIHGIIPEKGRLPHFRADRFIAVSDPVRDYLIKNNLAEKKNTHLIRHGIPARHVTAAKNHDEKKIICASRLVHEKGIDTFIRAAKIVSDTYGERVKFLIAGAGPCDGELRNLSARLEAKIEFLGEVKEISELLDTTHIFVMPSRSSSEGFPMSIAEAAVSKNMIICSRFIRSDPVFEENKDGLMFEVDDFRDLAGKILHALKNTEDAKLMENNFYKKSLELFSMERMVNGHSEVYGKCLKK